MNAKLSTEQFDQVAELAYPTNFLKLNQICIKKCGVDLTDKVGENEESNYLYLSQGEGDCIEACTRLYVRQTDCMIASFKKKMTIWFGINIELRLLELIKLSKQIRSFYC